MINLREFSVAAAAGLMRHARVGQLPRDYAYLERRVHVAMVEYHVCDAIIHQFDPRPQCFPDAIHATTQERRGRLSIWMVRRGQSRLPWHGIGCLDHRGRAQVLYAADIIDAGNCRPECVAGEGTPFVYHMTDESPVGNADQSTTELMTVEPYPDCAARFNIEDRHIVRAGR